ncbi:MAG TPA: GNAT family N-acetyltransferase [Devosia sp.]|mgnify:FL=1|jgi:aminoglycoside 6'-N-acetyltransferase I|nr:GNAT family N-acetyltransferase [Devosia sp.]
MPVIAKRLSAADASFFTHIAPDVFDEPADAQRLAAYLGAPGHIMVAALDGDTIVGQCAGVIHRHPDKPTELYVDEVGTASTHRRQGIARAMLDELFAWGRELGCTEAWLGTELDNIAANGLYRGYRPIEDTAIQFYLFKL